MLRIVETYPNYVVSLKAGHWFPTGRRGGSQGGHPFASLRAGSGPPLQGSSGEGASGVARCASAWRWARILASIPMSSGAIGAPITPQPAANDNIMAETRIRRRTGRAEWDTIIRLSWRDALPRRSLAGPPVFGRCPRFELSGQQPLRWSGTATRPWKNAGTRP